MTVGVLGLNLLFGGNMAPDFAWLTLKAILNLGAVLSLVAALGVSALRRRAPEKTLPPPPGAPWESMPCIPPSVRF